MGTVRYVLDRIPEEETRDSFMFNVRDSLPNVVTGNTFNIRWSVISFEKQNYKVNYGYTVKIQIGVIFTKLEICVVYK